VKSRAISPDSAAWSKTLLLAWLLAGGLAGFAPALEAAQGRVWFGEGDGVHWSDARNWVPVGVPQSGEDLLFELTGLTSPTDTINDLNNLSLHSLTFKSSFQFGFLGTVWTVRGNDLTIAAGMTLEAEVGDDLEVQIDCGIALSQSMSIHADSSIDEPVICRLNGPLDLNGHDLVFTTSDPQAPAPYVFRINSTITGHGNVRFVNASSDPDSSALAVFGGNAPNTFTGSLSVQRVAAARPFRVSFDKPGGNVVNGGLHIGDGCEVILPVRGDQIGDDAAVSITGGGRLLLNGHSETIGSLALTNVSADADPTLVDATGTTLTLRGGITTSVFNPDGNIPTIKGRLGLATGQHVFDLNNQSPPGPGLDLQAQVVGLGGFSKFGNATLALTMSNTFSGPVSVNDGILDIQNADALGTTASGLTVTDGTVTLRNVSIHDETLFVRGTRPVTANTAGSSLTCIGFGGWLGRIELDTNLVVNSTGLCLLRGPIMGPGGFEFLGSRHQILGSGSSSELSDFSGLTRALCDQLTVSRAPGFRGNLIVGGGFSPRCEVRWISPGVDRGVIGFPRLIVHTNGLVNVNGEDIQFLSTDFHGGRVSTGTGTFASGRVTVHPTNVTATIDGNLSSSSSGGITFTVHDGPANPDLSVNAMISDGLGTSIEKTGEGLMTLHRVNTYSGATLVQAGTLTLANDNALGATSQGTTVASGATVAFGAQVDTMLEPFTIAGSGVGGTLGALFTGADVWVNTNIVLSGPAAIRAEGTNSRIQVNNVSGTGPLTKLGSGRLVLRGNANNTYSGDTLVTEGVLDLAKPSNVASVPGHLVIGTTPVGTAPSARVEHRAHFTIVGSVTVNAGGLWDLNGSFEDWLGVNLQGCPPLTLNDGGDVQTGAGIFVLPAGGDIVVNPGPQRFDNSTITGRIGLDAGAHRISVGAGSLVLGGAECNVAAAISENGGVAELEKDGSGTLRLAGTNTHRGATLVSGGVLQVDGVQPQSAARIFVGGRLQGLGTVGLIELLGATATVTPGTTPSLLNPGSGILTCSNFNAGSVQDGVLSVKLNGTTPGTGHDQINARGTVRLTGLALQGSLGFASSIGQQFTIINNDGTDTVQGTFDGLAQNASVYLGGERFTVSYTGGTGNDVVLTRQVTPQLVVTTLPAREVPNFALDFDGLGSRINVGTNPFPTIVNNFTIELWANPTAARLETHEANLGISDLASQRYAVFPDHGDFGYGAGHAGAGLSIGTNGISVIEHAANQLPTLLVYSNAVPGWTHITLVFSNRLPRLYVNGTLARTGLISTKTVHPSANLGGSIQGLTYGNFQGQLDEVRIWNVVLSEEQIQTNLNRSLSGAEPGLVHYYRCEDPNGAPLMDSAPANPNILGLRVGGVLSVPSGAMPPAALNGLTVTLNGLASPDSVDASVWFEWGTTTNYGNVTATQSVSGFTRTAGFSQTLAGLAAGVYQFRAAGSNGLHFSFGENQSFTLLNGAPLLSIEAVTAGQVRLLWPTSAVGFTLQANADLNSANWSSVGTPPSVAGTNNVVLDSTTGSRRFYRLFHP